MDESWMSQKLPHWIVADATMTKRNQFLVLASICSLLLLTPSALSARAADFQTREQIKTYSITGTSGRELYGSIGQNGPKLGPTRTIAHTTFDLKWRRDYEPKGSACELVSAKPFFTVIYTIPKPAKPLTGALARKWQRFYDGMLTHEKVHGTHAQEMVSQIIRETVGLRVENDPKCHKIRDKVLARVKTAYADYKAKGRRFDGVEMVAGGAVWRLVGELVE